MEVLKRESLLEIEGRRAAGSQGRCDGLRSWEGPATEGPGVGTQHQLEPEAPESAT